VIPRIVAVAILRAANVKMAEIFNISNLLHQEILRTSPSWNQLSKPAAPRECFLVLWTVKIMGSESGERSFSDGTPNMVK
jgi:hypothetical protein